MKEIVDVHDYFQSRRGRRARHLQDLVLFGEFLISITNLVYCVCYWQHKKFTYLRVLKGNFRGHATVRASQKIVLFSTIQEF